MKYKVWVHVEQIDEKNDHYLDEFPGSLLPISIDEFGSPEEAYECIGKLKGYWGGEIDDDLEEYLNNLEPIKDDGAKA